jgi:hypothetical protein
MWQPIRTAPFDMDLELAVIEGQEVHALVFPCQRRVEGWVGSHDQILITVVPTHWRVWRWIELGQTDSLTWHPVVLAPFGLDLELAVLDDEGDDVYDLPCRKAVNGWIDAKWLSRVDFKPTHWRRWKSYEKSATEIAIGERERCLQRGVKA